MARRSGRTATACPRAAVAGSHADTQRRGNAERDPDRVANGISDSEPDSVADAVAVADGESSREPILAASVSLVVRLGLCLGVILGGAVSLPRLGTCDGHVDVQGIPPV